jgi:nitronate monooxygenase
MVPLFSLLPEVIAVAGTRPVLAAGGIVDGRGLAAVLCLGAAGVLMGTRFLATEEAPVSANYKQAIVAAKGSEATAASTIFDIIWEDAWPGVQVRALRNNFIRRWLGREEALPAQLAEAQATLQQADVADDSAERGLLAGMGAARIHDVRPAGQIIHDMIAEAAQVLSDMSTMVST